MKRPLAALALVAATVLAGAAQTAESPRPGPFDPRIRSIFYNPLQVFTIDGFYGYQLMLEFAPEERIEIVSIGDSLAWQVTPNKRATLLFLKPLTKNAATNMTVVTNQRRYAFELRARKVGTVRRPDMAYVVRFTYPPPPLPPPAPPPPPPEPPPPPPERKNVAYSYSGAVSSLPRLVFDDGHFTYFQWPEAVAIPAIFQVAADGSEGLVNYAMRDGFVVVEHLAPKFKLRNGAEVTTLFNDGWRSPAAEPGSPLPHDSRAAREAAREAKRVNGSN